MRQINNSFYDELQEKWYSDTHHPIALLRRENAARNPWILKTLQERGRSHLNVLDVGCGAGFLTNALAKEGHKVVGIDLSPNSLRVAKDRDETKSVSFFHGDARELPFTQRSFDAVCAMDLLEHVESPHRVIQEAARVLKPGGFFFFHTFNRNWLSRLIVIQGLKWWLPDSPPNLHVYPLFIKPSELKKWCQSSALEVEEMHGLVPHLFSLPFLKSFVCHYVDEKMEFRFSSSLKTGYLGYAVLR
jgi:2-polyprenyl-6-hydroxyphenyl methylase / 3-demethylubiquinone-9 3-methyltransferase